MLPTIRLPHPRRTLQETLELLARHGYWVLFLNVLLEQIGIPVPAVPVLFGMGALIGMERFSLAQAIGVAVAACLVSDSIWYTLGRVKGQSVLKTLCRISLEPDSCVSMTKGWFERLGPSALLFAKFVPGFSTVAQPMAGANRVHPLRFLLMDGVGSAIWASAYLGLGFAFHDQAAAIWTAMTRLGAWLVVLLLAALAVYLLVKYYQRTIYIRALRGNRMAVDELRDRLESENPPVVLDLRRAGEVRSLGRTLPTARWVDMTRLRAKEIDLSDFPEGREIVLFCS